MDETEAPPSTPSPRSRSAPQPFQRTIILKNSAGRVEGRVEDNVHDFSVALEHDGDLILSVAGGALRTPWTSCPFAVRALDVLVGTPLVGGARIDPTQQCTHLFDLARLAIAQAARGDGKRRYDVKIARTRPSGAAQARLWRDGERLLDWRVQDGLVMEGGPFTGHRTDGRAIWPDPVADRGDLIEAGLVLRRCLLVFRGRRRSTEDVERASELEQMIGVCFSFQPERSSTALRPKGFRDFVRAPINGEFAPDAPPHSSVATTPRPA